MVHFEKAMLEYIGRRGHVLPSCAHCPHIDIGTASEDIQGRNYKYNAHEERFTHQNPGVNLSSCSANGRRASFTSGKNNVFLSILFTKTNPTNPATTKESSSTKFGIKRHNKSRQPTYKRIPTTSNN